MAIQYPLDLRTIIIGRQKTQTAKIADIQPLSGPAYVEKRSTDAPVIYEGVFRFGSHDDALLFRAWVEHNGIDKGVEFEIPVKTEGSDSGGQEKQLVQLVPSGGGDVLSNVHQAGMLWEYSAIMQCRKETTGLEQHYELINAGGAYLLRGRHILDVATNKSAPEA